MAPTVRRPSDGEGERARCDAATPGRRAVPDEPRADGGIVPGDRTPTWRERKARTAGLARLTYEYFERSRYEDQVVRGESDYVERDVLAFPTWPHEVSATSPSRASSWG